MNNNDFKQHFINALYELGITHYDVLIFTVIPVHENDKACPNARDDIMRLCFLLRKRELKFDEVMKLFTWNEGYYPCWIRITVLEGNVQLATSLRMRKAEKKDDKRFYPFRME